MDFLPLATLPDLDDPPSLPVVSDSEVSAARGYVEASRAASTRRAYEAQSPHRLKNGQLGERKVDTASRS
jgi:hypothetical protein